MDTDTDTDTDMDTDMDMDMESMFVIANRAISAKIYDRFAVVNKPNRENQVNSVSGNKVLLNGLTLLDVICPMHMLILLSVLVSNSFQLI